MKKIKIILGDFRYSNEFTSWNEYVPLGIGYIATYLKQLFGDSVESSLFTNHTELLEYARNNKIDLIGLSFYCWNEQMDRLVAKKLRKICGKIPLIIGGPSIDMVEEEQRKIFTEFPEIDAVVENEGEVGFANIVKEYLSSNLWKNAIDGASFMKDGCFIKGKPVQADLNTLNSPYLEGLMDPFQNLLPCIQSSRGCPYSCSFCGTPNQSKIRRFPIERVKEELDFLVPKYKDKDSLLVLSDTNFGFFPSDVELAEYIKKLSDEANFPRHIFFYNNKKITKYSKRVIEILKDENELGLTMSFQSDNKKTLEAVRRNNISPEELDDAMRWASERNILTASEIIFGLPYETKETFSKLLETIIKAGFDVVQCYNLLILKGMALNRASYREKYNIETKYRILAPDYAVIEDEVCFETEEVVVSNDTFSFEDFVAIRKLTVMIYSIYGMYMYKWFFNALMEINISPVDFLSQLMNPDRSEKWPDGYLKFIDDLTGSFLSELHSSKQEIEDELKAEYKKHKKLPMFSRINAYFGARLIYMEKWMEEVLLIHLKKYKLSPEKESLIKEALEISRRERIDFGNIVENQSLTVNYDFISWRNNKYRIPLKKTAPRKLSLTIKPENKERILSFTKEFEYIEPNDFFFKAVSSLTPRHILLYDLDYKD